MYTPPLNDNVNFGFVAGGYVPPGNAAVNFNFGSDTGTGLPTRRRFLIGAS